MAAETRYAVASSAPVHRRPRSTGTLYWAMATCVAAVGILDSGCDAPAMTHGLWKELHPLFGLLLLGWVASLFYRRARSSPAVQPPDLREFSRRISRTVFLLLYTVVFARQIIALFGLARPGGAFALKSYLWMPVGQRSCELGSDVGFYVAWGVAALVMIRILARLLHRTRVAQGGRSFG